MLKSESESRSLVSDSLQPHGLYGPWNSPDQNTGVGSLSLLQGIFPNQGSNQGPLHCRQILYQLSGKPNVWCLFFLISWDIFYGPGCGLPWWMLRVSLRRMKHILVNWLIFIFGCAGSLCELSSSCGSRAALHCSAQASRCSGVSGLKGFSSCGCWSLEHAGFSTCAAWT